MKKSILAVAGLAAVAGVVGPVAGAFATEVTETPTVTDTITVTIESACSLASGDTTASDNTITRSLTKTLENGTSTEGSTGAITVKCNDNGGWSLKAVGAGEYTDHVDYLKGSSKISGSDNYNYIPSSATFVDSNSKAVSAWGFKLATSDGTNAPISGGYASYSAIPTDSTTVVATGNVSTAAGITITPTYKISASSTQAADTYTGKVVYTLVHPNSVSATE